MTLAPGANQWGRKTRGVAQILNGWKRETLRLPSGVMNEVIAAGMLSLQVTTAKRSIGRAAAERLARICCGDSGGIKAVFLAKRAAKSTVDSTETTRRAVPRAEREYVPIEDDPTTTPEGALEEASSAPAKPSMHDVFGPGGFLERSMIGGYEHRPAQLEMAERVHDAFETHHHAILEAGTGTGKTLAYLLPAICSGRRVVISTATKSLQEQLYQKDIPFLQKHFAPNLKVAVM
jgi:hypothetical protein